MSLTEAVVLHVEGGATACPALAGLVGPDPRKLWVGGQAHVEQARAALVEPEQEDWPPDNGARFSRARTRFHVRLPLDESLAPSQVASLGRRREASRREHDGQDLSA